MLSFFGNIKAFKEWQYWKTCVPIVVTVLGMLIAFKFEQPKNAEPPKPVMLLPMYASTSLLDVASFGFVAELEPLVPNT